MSYTELQITSNFSFLRGPAGTGKTWLARRMVKEYPGTLLCATTGIAAVNLGEGTTINAALGYFDTASLIEAYTSGFLTSRLGKLWRSGVRRILLDEVSMMDAEQLTVLTRALAQELAAADMNAVALQGQLATQLLQSGLQETGMSTSLYQALIQMDQTQAQNMGKAIANFAGALAPKTSINIGGGASA